jgi:hypothetical protein
MQTPSFTYFRKQSFDVPVILVRAIVKNAAQAPVSNLGHQEQLLQGAESPAGPASLTAQAQRTQTARNRTHHLPTSPPHSYRHRRRDLHAKSAGQWERVHMEKQKESIQMKGSSVTVKFRNRSSKETLNMLVSITNSHLHGSVPSNGQRVIFRELEVRVGTAGGRNTFKSSANSFKSSGKPALKAPPA